MAAEEKAARKPAKKPAYAVESAKPEDAAEAEAEEALAAIEGEEEPAAADEDETFLEEEEEDGSDMTGIIGGPVAEPDEPRCMPVGRRKRTPPPTCANDRSRGILKRAGHTSAGFPAGSGP